MFSNTGHAALLLLLTVIAVTFSAMYLLTPYFGDDWGYMMVFRAPEGYDADYPLWQFWFFGLRHWWGANGRMANFLAAGALGVCPSWMLDILLGLAAAAGAALMIKVAGVWDRRGFASAGIITACCYALLFPWWDLMFTVDFAFNYPVSLAVVLAAVYLFGRLRSVRLSRWGKVLTALAGLTAGCMHESATLPLLAGAALLTLREKKWQSFSGGQRLLAVTFAVGTAVATFSPGIIRRALYGGAAPPDDTALILVVKSAPLTLIILAAYILSLVFSRHQRNLAPKLFSTPALAWAVAAIIALLPVAAGGIVGRSGWFSQAYMLIFALCWIRTTEIRLPRAVAAALAAVAATVTAAQSVATVVTATEFHSRITAINRAWLSSPDGIVYAPLVDYTTRPFWTLQRIDHRTQENYYDRLNMTRYYRRPALPVILPTEASAVELDTVTRAAFPDGTVISATPMDATAEADTLAFTTATGRRLYLSFPRRHRSWGERH